MKEFAIECIKKTLFLIFFTRILMSNILLNNSCVATGLEKYRDVEVSQRLKKGLPILADI